tara:strand:+ start:335 stop:520 length:186 start_codon:yes stop_codon:yes gene_type:complete
MADEGDSCTRLLDKFKINNLEKIIYYISLVIITLTVESVVRYEYQKIKNFLSIKIKDKERE